MKAKFLALLAAAAVSITGCSLDQINFLPTAKIRAQIPQITFEGSYSPSKQLVSVTTKSQTVSFQADTGSMAATVTGFEVQFEDQSGNPINVAPKPQTLNIFVSAGETCDDKGKCQFTPGAIVKSVNPVDFFTQEAGFKYMDRVVATGQFPGGWRARITFFARNANGVDFQWQEVQSIACLPCSIGN